MVERRGTPETTAGKVSIKEEVSECTDMTETDGRKTAWNEL